VALGSIVAEGKRLYICTFGVGVGYCGYIARKVISIAGGTRSDHQWRISFVWLGVTTKNLGKPAQHLTHQGYLHNALKFYDIVKQFRALNAIILGFSLAENQTNERKQASLQASLALQLFIYLTLSRAVSRRSILLIKRARWLAGWGRSFFGFNDQSQGLANLLKSLIV